MVDDLCEGRSEEVHQGVVGLPCYGEQTWKRLDQLRWCGNGGRSTSMRTGGEAMSDQEGKLVKAKWVRISKGMDEHPEARCRLFARECAYG